MNKANWYHDLEQEDQTRLVTIFVACDNSVKFSNTARLYEVFDDLSDHQLLDIYHAFLTMFDEARKITPVPLETLGAIEA